MMLSREHVSGSVFMFRTLAKIFRPDKCKKLAPHILRLETRLCIEIDMINAGARDYLVNIAKAYVAATGRAMTTVSRLSYGHHEFFAGYEAGEKSIATDKYDTVLEWFREHWPKGTPKPPFPTLKFRKKQ